MSNDAPREPFLTIQELALHEIAEAASRVDAEVLGRFLRAHLIVEHFVTEALQRRNQRLGRLRDARLSYSQKLELLGSTGLTALLQPGLRRLNKLRNDLAHELSSPLTLRDVQPLLAPKGFFDGYLEGFRKRRGLESVQPVDVVEAFAEFVAAMLRLDTALDEKQAIILHELGLKEARIAGVSETLEAWKRTAEATADESQGEDQNEAR